MRFKETRLKRVAHLAAGGTPSVDESRFWSDTSGFSWVTIGDMTRQPAVRNTERHLTKEGIASKRLPIGRKGTILFAIYASVGAVSVLDTDASWNQAILGIEPRPSLAEHRFVAYWLSSLRPRLQEFFRSNTQNNLNAEQVGNLPYPVLPVEQQRAIADFLDAETARIDTLIAKKHHLSLSVEERFKAERDRHVRHLMDRHDRTVVRRLINRVEQGWSPSCEDRTADVDQWGVLKTSAVTKGTFDETENKCLPNDFKPDLRWVVKDGDVLAARGSGSINRVGVAAVAATEGRKLLLSDLIYRLVGPRMHPALLAHCINSSTGRAHLESSIRTDVGQTLKIRGDDLLDVPIPAVPLKLQAEALRAIGKSMQLAGETQGRLSTQIDLLAEHRQALITAAVTGEIKVPRVALP